MGRPRGSRNAGFDERRREIARAVMHHLARPGGSSASLRELSRAAEVSLPTLVHYFGDRDGLLSAAMVEMREAGEPWLKVARTARLDLPLGASVRWFLGLFAIGWDRGLGLTVSQSLAAGLDQDTLGPASVDAVLEPVLRAIEDRLAAHAAELAEGVDLRHAALALGSPVVLAMLHQRSLGGSRCRPLDLERFLDDHVARWVRG
ncbi:MAG: TetR/AcrR family transcriptional regulator [Myxococcota bacterium]